jgi:hypothetical protein
MLRQEVVAALGALALMAAGAPARAEGADGVYGRFNGDLDLRLDAGAAFAQGGPALAAGATALYLETAGIYVHYTDALGGDAPDVARSIAVGAIVTPLFLARYGKDLEHGPPHLDLFLDSFGLAVGAFWDAPRRGGLRPDAGLELAATLGVPILPRATGPFLGLRAALRFRADDLSGRPGGDIFDRGAVLSVTLSFHQIIDAGLVDAGDELPR